MHPTPTPFISLSLSIFSKCFSIFSSVMWDIFGTPSCNQSFIALPASSASPTLVGSVDRYRLVS